MKFQGFPVASMHRSALKFFAVIAIFAAKYSRLEKNYAFDTPTLDECWATMTTADSVSRAE